MEVMCFDAAVEAWNVDGSSDAQAESGSWLRGAEEATGRHHGRCSPQTFEAHVALLSGEMQMFQLLQTVAYMLSQLPEATIPRAEEGLAMTSANCYRGGTAAYEIHKVVQPSRRSL